MGSELLLAEQRQLSKQLILLQKADSGRDCAMVFGFQYKPLSLGGDFPPPSFSRRISHWLRVTTALIVPPPASERQSGVVLGVTRDKKFLGQVVTENRTSSLRGPAFVNRLHDFLGPPHSVCDCAHSCRNSFSAIKLSELAGGEDTRRDQQHAFAAFVHSTI